MKKLPLTLIGTILVAILVALVVYGLLRMVTFPEERARLFVWETYGEDLTHDPVCKQITGSDVARCTVRFDLKGLPVGITLSCQKGLTNAPCTSPGAWAP